MNARDIHEFVRRDRTAVEASRHAYWAGLFQRDGWRPLWHAAQALFAHARAVRPDFPGDSERDADLAHHQQLLARLGRTAHAFPRR